MSDPVLAVNIRGYLKSCGEDAMVARLDDRVADLAAARRENATLREAILAHRDTVGWNPSQGGVVNTGALNKACGRLYAALAASPAAEEPQP